MSEIKTRGSLQDIQEIRALMERSSRFISLSGLSGIIAGLFALVACWFAYDWITEYVNNHPDDLLQGPAYERLCFNLIGMAVCLFLGALSASLFLTYRRAKKHQVSVWNMTSKRLLWNVAVPILTGAVFVLVLLQHEEWELIAPSSLIFYGLALVNGSKFTVTDIRYLGYMQIVLGLIATQFPGYGLHFWAAGFGVLHIIYGALMWWKYDRLD